MRRALVLAGGGYVASAWEIGVVAGLADAHVDVRSADLFVGTSAGARVALELASDRPLEEIYRQRADIDETGARPGGGTAPKLDWAWVREHAGEARQAGGSRAEILRRYGALALALGGASGPAWRERVAAQLPLVHWPKQRMLITAVNAETGERRAFDRASGIDLVDAILATTASFGAPPMSFAGQHYIDGGYYSSDNADLAIGYERVLILALRSPPGAMRLVSIEAGVAELRAAGSEVEVVHPDDDTVAALIPTGGQMNPASGKPAAVAGRLQGQRAAIGHVAGFWR